MELNEKQTIALDLLEDDITEEITYGGAAGGGKSILGAYFLLKQAHKYPETRWLMGRESLTTLKETTLISFFKVCKMQRLIANTHYKYYDNPKNFISFPNGSIILLKDLGFYPADPDFDELGSLEITGAFVDEAPQIKVKAKNVVKSRIRHMVSHYGLKPKILYGCNPSKGWLYTEFYKPFKDGTLPKDKAFIQAFVNDNPDIDTTYKANLLKLPKNLKERLLYGNWEYDDDPTVLCDYDAICDCFTNYHVPSGDKAISADLAMQGRDRFVVGSWDGLRCSIDIDKEKATGKSIETDLKGVMEKKKIGRSQTVADSDGLGSYLESYLEGIREFHGGAQAISLMKDPTTGKPVIEYGNLKSQCAYELAARINSREILINCTPEQKEIIIEELGVLKADNVDADERKKKIISKEKMKEILGHSPDYLDMLLMRMIFILKPKRKFADASY
jgi:phage terminase large subunit